MTLQELLNMGTAAMIEYINTMPRERLFALFGVLENKDNQAKYGIDPDYDVALRTVTARCRNIEDHLLRAADREQTAFTEKAAVHHARNFTNKDGISTASWGAGSDTIKKMFGE